MTKSLKLFEKNDKGNQKKDPTIKFFFRNCWKLLLTFKVIISYFLNSNKYSPHIFYGGARSGDNGGPLVKIKRLKQYFPEYKWRYNLVYTLSNAAYLSPLAINLLSKKDIPIVLNQNGIFHPSWYSGNCKKMNDKMAYIYHRADYVFWQSEFCKKAASKFLGNRAGPGEVLFNAIDTSLFIPKATGKKSDEFIFLITGNINAHLYYRIKNVLIALKRVRDDGMNAKLKIAGFLQPDVFSNTNLLINKLNIRDHVILKGQFSQLDAPDIYNSSDVYILTKYMDPCPNTVLEAMSSGLPIIYSDSGGVPELVGDSAGVGLYVPEIWDSSIYTPTAESIASAMITVFQQKNEMSYEARNRAVSMFDISNWIKKHEDIFKKLMETH